MVILEFAWDDCICGGSAACPVHNRELMTGNSAVEEGEIVLGYRTPTPCRWIPTIEQGATGWKGEAAT